MQKVAVFGMGYVGCVTAACLARDGHQVTGVDVDAQKVARVNAGDPPVSEPGLPGILQEAVRSGKLRATTSVDEGVDGSDVALIAVGTPSADSGAVDTRAVERVLQSIGSRLKESGRQYTVVLRSTLLPGILEERLAPVLYEAGGPGARQRLKICNNPEFLRESSAIKDYDAPPFIVVGAENEADAAPVFDLYAGLPGERFTVSTRTAAMVKYVCNAFHALKVAFANEVGVLARSLGADGHEVMQLVCRDTKLNISPAYMRPGFAFGGSCLPKDLRALTRHAEEHSLQLPLMPAILQSNENQLRRAVRLIEQTRLRRIGLVGLSFKAHTDDLRESPLVMLAEILLGKGFELRILDPGIQVTRLHGRNLAYVDQHLPHLARLLCETQEELLSHAELLVLGTDVADGLAPGFQAGRSVMDLRRDLARPQV
ncbi:MAG TPA: GDP-mannose dehydrogenase [Planctomycetaceae bacterium]|nr:GDP-mannose dehydrogenase [Planctomycetaceae bacterium]